jgi:flagellar basal body-associated protein FliL
MIRLIATALWICIVTALSGYAASMWETQSTPEAEVDKLFGGLQSMQTSMISVPIVSDGAVQGYVVAQFTFTMNSDVVRRMSVKPDVFLLDAAFRAIYGGDPSVLRGSRKQDLQELTASIKERANARFGKPLIEDVLFETYNFVPKSEARTGANLVKMRPDFVH